MMARNASASAIPDEIFYHFAKTNQSTEDLIRSIYATPTATTIDYFKSVNSHLKNGMVMAGQMVVVIPPDSQQCTRFESDLAEAAPQLDEAVRKEKEAVS